MPKFISKIELEERIKDAQSEIRMCNRELKRRERDPIKAMMERKKEKEMELRRIEAEKNGSD